MTNREHLATLDSQRLADWVLYGAVEIGRMSNNSRLWLAEWLDSEYQGWINLHERGAWIMAQIDKGGEQQ